MALWERETYDLDSNFALGTFDFRLATTVLVVVRVSAAAHLRRVESCNKFLVRAGDTAGAETDIVECTVTAKETEMDRKGQGDVREHEPCENTELDDSRHGKRGLERPA